MYCGDEVAAVVGDVGSEMAKFGYAGEDTPRVVCPGSIGIVDPKGTADTQNKPLYYAGSAAGFRRDNMKVTDPYL